jgi:hypothetical protein
MSFYEDLNELYAKKIVKRVSLTESVINEDMPPIGPGEYYPTDPKAKEVLYKHATMTRDPKTGETVTAHPRSGGKGGMKRFYLAFIRELEPITPDASVVVAIAILSDVLKKLSEYPDGIYPEDNRSFYLEIIKPSIEKVIPQLTKGTAEAASTNAGYIARALKNAAIEAKILRTEGRVKKIKKMPKADAPYSVTSDDLDKLLGL